MISDATTVLGIFILKMALCVSASLALLTAEAKAEDESLSLYSGAHGNCQEGDISVRGATSVSGGG